jgi:hypothetical protein
MKYLQTWLSCLLETCLIWREWVIFLISLKTNKLVPIVTESKLQQTVNIQGLHQLRVQYVTGLRGTVGSNPFLHFVPDLNFGPESGFFAGFPQSTQAIAGTVIFSN